LGEKDVEQMDVLILIALCKRISLQKSKTLLKCLTILIRINILYHVELACDGLTLLVESTAWMAPGMIFNRWLRHDGGVHGLSSITSERVEIILRDYLGAILPRTDRGGRRKLSATLQEAIEGLALQKPPLPISVLCNRAQLLAESLGEEPPSYDLVHDVVSHLPADLVTLASGSNRNRPEFRRML
jgi:hypothetical protein